MREAQPTDWRTFQELRLASLRGAPDSYRRVYADEVGVADARWREFLEQTAADAATAVLLVEVGREPRGLAFVGVDDEAILSLGGMWIAPEVRRRGIGSQLLQDALEWGRRRGAEAARLAVTLDNPGAEQLYSAAGFVATGDTEPLREDSRRTVAWMERPL